MNTNAMGRPRVHGPLLILVFGPFLVFGPCHLNFHHFWLKFSLKIAKGGWHGGARKCRHCRRMGFW